jgi:hypothetical protein
MPTPGDDHSVNPGTASWEDGRFMHTAGASQRLVVEMTSPPTVYSVLAGPERDVEHRDLGLTGSVWDRWNHCDLEKRSFPVDWSKVQTAQATL